MLELFSFLLALGTALITILDKIDLAERRKLARKIHEIYNQLQIIIDDADKIFTLIQTADEQIREYGKDKFKKIIQDNFKHQFLRIESLTADFIYFDMSVIFEKLDKNLQNKIRRMLNLKRDSIGVALARIAFSKSKMEVKNGQLYIKNSILKRKKSAFPNIDKQFEALSKLKECSQSLEVKISSVIDLTV